MSVKIKCGSTFHVGRIAAGTMLSLAASTAGWAQAPGATDAGGELEEIIVRGVRGSVESAQEVKRTALQVTDSIVAEDIGKLPDNSVAEALARVTGVQINRTRADASLTLVRGLPNVVTTLNGREIFTTTGRGIALADIPADLLQRVDVRKSNSPEHLSGGVAGGIDVALRRPFDFEESATAFSARGIYSDQAESTSPVGSALVSHRWDVGGGEFGALLGVSYQDVDYHEQNTFNAFYNNIPNPSNPAQLVARPDVIGSINTFGNHARTSVNGALQWRPNDRVEFTLDAFHVKYDEDYENNFWIPLPCCGAPVAATVKPDSNVVDSMRIENGFTLTSQQAFKRESHTQQFSLGADVTINERIQWRTTLAYTESTADNRTVILDTAFIAPRTDMDFNVGGATSAVITNLDGSPYDVTDSSIYFLNQLFDRRDDAQGKDYSLSSDLSFAMDGFFSSFDTGIRVNSRTANFNGANEGGIDRNRFSAPGQDNLVFIDQVEALTGRAGIQDVSPRGMLDDDRNIGTPQYFVPNREFLLNNTDVLRELFLIPGGGAPPPNDPTRFFDHDEDTTAVYAQMKFDTTLGSMGFDGVFGARYVRTDFVLRGFSAAVLTPFERDDTDSDLLPSFNGRLKLTDDAHLRLALFKTVTRPNFPALNPGTTLTSPGPTLPGQGTGGNPFLETTEAKSADLAFEWYFSPGSLFSTTVFYRDLEGYIQNFVRPEFYNAGQRFDVTRPENSDGDMKGAEVAYTQFFDMLPGIWSDFGVQLNYTHIDANAVNNLTGEEEDITNVSDNSYNAILMYENDRLSARVAYNWRSDYVEAYTADVVAPGAVRVKPISILDFSMGFNASENVTLTFDATNLLDRPQFNYFGGGSASSEDARLYNRDMRSNDRTFSVGVRVRL